MQKKFIFVTGAPGSKWSSVVKNIYLDNQVIDQTDRHPVREYYHDASGKFDLMHLGAYWDPGMEFGDWFDQLSKHSMSECEDEFNRAFKDNDNPLVRYKLIKSHVFAHHIDFLRTNWPQSPVVLVHRPDDACLGWWVKCGQFDITYPLYRTYYKNLRSMSKIISQQNQDILKAWQKYPGKEVVDNFELSWEIGLPRFSDEFRHDYPTNDIRVKVIK